MRSIIEKSLYPTRKRRRVIGLIILIVLIFILVGAFPRWSYNQNWGYAPSGFIGLVLVVILILVLMDHIPYRI